MCNRLKITATGAWASYNALDWVPMGVSDEGSAALPTWFPSIASVKFVIGCPHCPVANVLIDDVYLTQSPTITNTSGDAWCADSSTSQITIALDEDNLGVTGVGKPLRFAVRVSSTAQPTVKMSKWRLTYKIRSPLGDVLSSGNLGQQDLESNSLFQVRLEKSVRGAMLFEYNASANVASSEIYDSGAYRLLLGSPVPALQPEDYDDHFRFCGTPQFETHLLWQAGERLPLRFKRLVALGVNTQHHYTGFKEMNNTLQANGPAVYWYELDWVKQVMRTGAEHGILWLLTVDEHPGGAGWAEPPVTTASGLSEWSAIVGRTVAALSEWVRWVEVINEANTYLTGQQYLASCGRPRRSSGNDPSIKVLGPSEVCGAGRLADCKGIWDLVMKEELDLIDQFSMHPYQFAGSTLLR